jgi:hypothetical protein
MYLLNDMCIELTRMIILYEEITCIYKNTHVTVM